MRLVGASAAEGLLSVEELLAWALPRLADGGADSGHAAAAAVLPLLQASLWVRPCGRCLTAMVIGHTSNVLCICLWRPIICDGSI